MARSRTAARTARRPARAAAPAAAPADPGFITVRIGKLPGRIDQIGLNGGRKVRDALVGATLDADGYEIKVNATPANAETDLKEGDIVLLVRKVRGNG